MNHFGSKFSSPGSSTTSTTSSGSPQMDRRVNDDEDEGGERIRYPSDETDDSSNFALPMFNRRYENYGANDREPDFSSIFQPVAPVRSFIQFPPKPSEWEHVLELMSHCRNAEGCGSDTYKYDQRQLEAPAISGFGGNGNGLFNVEHMELLSNKAGNFPIARPGSDHGRSGMQPEIVTNGNMFNMADLAEALKQVREKFNNRPPAVCPATLLTNLGLSQNQGNRNLYDAGDAMVLSKFTPVGDRLTMSQQPGGGFGFGQDSRFNLTGNASLGMRPPPPHPRGDRMNIRVTFGQLGHRPSDLDSPHGFAIGRREEIIVADTYHHLIKIFNKEGHFIGHFGNAGKEVGHLWYPRKVAVLRHNGFFVVCDRGGDRSRMQIFDDNGRFVKQIEIKFVDIVAGLTTTPDGKIVVMDSVRPTVFIIDPDNRVPIKYLDIADTVSEPSDIVVYNDHFYICDFKGHAIVVINLRGQSVCRISTENISLFPNGVDVSDHGDILVGDSHGNQFHVAVFDSRGQFLSHFICPDIKVSRCCGLKITSEGYIVTVAKNNHHVLVLDTLFI